MELIVLLPLQTQNINNTNGSTYFNTFYCCNFQTAQDKLSLTTTYK